MPAPVPPGYTRGPLLFLGAATHTPLDTGLRQWLWREAGGYGARMVVITVEAAHVEEVQTLAHQLAAWECDQVREIVALDRLAARLPAHAAPVEAATAVVLLGSDPLRLSAILGGTPLAQAIRRANARSKVVAGMGAAAAFLGQHAIGPGRDSRTLRGAVAFAPGLGLVNRLTVDATATAAPLPTDHRTRILAAVCANPFLVGVGLEPGSAAVLYPDNTLQAIGGAVTVVDGQGITVNDLEGPPTPEAVEGEIIYTLAAGDGFNLDDHSLCPAGEIDLPPTGPVTSAF